MRGREVRGAPYSAQWESSTHSGSPDVYRELVGFRLVHDNSVRVIRGGSWNVSSEDARAGFRFRYVPADCDNALGLRLICDKEAT